MDYNIKAIKSISSRRSQPDEGRRGDLRNLERETWIKDGILRDDAWPIMHFTHSRRRKQQKLLSGAHRAVERRLFVRDGLLSRQAILLPLHEGIHFFLIEQSLLFLPLALKEVPLDSEPLHDHLGGGKLDHQPSGRLSNRQSILNNKGNQGLPGLSHGGKYLQADRGVLEG